MSKFLIRNDDVAYDTNLDEIKKFCEICDKHGFKIIQAITPIGECRKVNSRMQNEDIRIASFKRFEENKEVYEFLKNRNDLIGVHGLWHTHAPTQAEIRKSKEMLCNLGFKPAYFVPPFNEGEYSKEIEGLKTCKLSIKSGQRLEDFLKKGTPMSPIMYLHSWRFNEGWYTFEQLDECLARIATNPASTFRLWYNNWVKKNAKGDVLDVGKSRHWNYGFPTIDLNAKLKPTYVGDIHKTDFPDETFDTVLCNGMYEFVDNPQRMIDETIRITKKGGIIIFGFVGKDYKPYKEPWKFYEGKENLPEHVKIDYGNEYHFIIVSRK